MTETLFTILYAMVTLGILATACIYSYYFHKLGVGSAPSSARARRAIFAEIQSLGMTAPAIVDMGSGAGGLVRFIARAMPSATVTGLDLSVPAHGLASLRARIFGPRNARFQLMDFNNYDLSKTDIVVTYLPGAILNKLSDHLKTLPKDAVVLCLSYPLPENDWTMYREIRTGNLFEPALYCHRAKA